MPHNKLLEQFSAYYQLMRARTDEGKASDESKMEAASYLEQPDDSKLDASGFHNGCCYGFSMIRLISLRALLNDVWHQMLMAVEEWDRTYDSLSDRISIDWNDSVIAVTRGAIFRTVMRKVIGIQYRRHHTWDEDDASDPEVQKKLSKHAFLAPTTKFDTNFTSHEKIKVTEKRLIKKLRDKEFQAECKSGVGLSSVNHQTILYYDDAQGWWFDDINKRYYKHRTKSATHTAKVIIRTLGKTLYISRLENCNLALVEDLLPLVEETEMDRAFIEGFDSLIEAQGVQAGELSEDSMDELLGLSRSFSPLPMEGVDADDSLGDSSLEDLANLSGSFSTTPIKEASRSMSPIRFFPSPTPKEDAETPPSRLLRKRRHDS